MLWFTADLHFNHVRILEYCDRPYANLDEMNAGIIRDINAYVLPGDTLIIIGDVAMGIRSQSVPLLDQINGKKYLVPGNHDNCHPAFAQKSSYPDNFALYSQYCEITPPQLMLSEITGVPYQEDVLLCHFPYLTDPDAEVRHGFEDAFPQDEGIPLFCGHVHDAWRTKRSHKGTKMVNLGLDANYYRPIPYPQAMQILHDSK